MSKVIVALSGGVDSTAAAIILKRQGFNLCAVHMQNWDRAINEDCTDEDAGCTSNLDLAEVKKICAHLNIPLYTYNFVEEYWENVFVPHLNDLRQNLNTNPDIACNSKIKFGVLLKRLEDDFGQDIKLATGHWANVIYERGEYFLSVCNNLDKDQTYFLSNLTQQQLSKALFPLSSFSSKSEIRQIVKENGLDVWDKRDSTGICFVGKRNYSDFISNYIENKPGDFIDVQTNQILGRHKGIHLYVHHQRSGLFLRGYPDKYYVCRKDMKTNSIFLCKESDIPKYLHRKESECRSINWINSPPVVGQSLKVKTRHTPLFFDVVVRFVDEEKIIVYHDRRYVTSPGQRIVFYDSDGKICLGGGTYVE